ncbi:MAG: prolyl oligopeptidase family serine peptidase [Actinomycetes bacterium]
MNLTPPVARRSELTHTLHGDTRTDPYGWITDPFAPETAALLAAERDYYDARTANLIPLRTRLAAEMTSRVPARERSAPWESGGWQYVSDTAPGNEYPTLTRRPIAASSSDDTVLLDLQRVHDEGGTGYLRAGQMEVSPNGDLLAWSLDLDGNEVYELRFRDLTTGADLADVIPRTYYGGAWTADSRAFLYVVHDEAYRPHQVWRHQLGTDAADDTLLLDEPDDRYEIMLHASRSGAWAVITLLARDTVEQHLVSLDDPNAGPAMVRPRADGVEYSLEHAPGHGPNGSDGFYVVTNLNAVEFRIAWADDDSPSEWAPVVDEDPTERILDVDAFALGYVVSLRRDGVTCLRIVRRDGTSLDVVPHEAGGMVSAGRNDDYAVDYVTVVEESFIIPAVHADISLTDGSLRERHRITNVGVDPSDYVSERHLVDRGDGTVVPVITVRHRSTPLDGTAPTLLYGYGSYEVSCDPDWGIDWWRSLPSLLDRGVVFAVGHPRGGGELGRGWWEDGHLSTKHHTFDDQAAIADFLAAGHVDGARIVTRGISAGGLLQGALYSRRPDRWAGIIAEVPFVDVITTMCDASLPLTAQEWREWGDPRDAVEYEWLRSWSPIDNRPPVTSRPPLLVTGAVHDPRVLVREPAKWVAALRDDDPDRGVGVDPTSPVSARTILFRCETGAGAHGGPSGRFAELEYEAEIAAWALAAMGLGDADTMVAT